MCCIFTCCGWMIDLVQRAWVFFMSCCIASAVCCVFIVTSMSGVALGYNYSLAEYIELKETNVSVYLKRGIFDDEIADETDWRRRGGGMPYRGLKGDDFLTAPPDEPEQMPESGRRLDDTILQSDESNKFEGNLMKLTAKIPFESTVTEPVPADEEMQQIISKHAPGSLEQLKAIQALINERKLKAPRDPNVKRLTTHGYNPSHLAQAPDGPSNSRRMMGPDGADPGLRPYLPMGKDINRFAAARNAVPSALSRAEWVLPKITPTADDDIKRLITYPKPVYMNLGPIRPTQPAPPKGFPTPTKAEIARQMDVEPTPMDTGIANKADMVGDVASRFGIQRQHGPETIKTESGGWKKSEIDYYDEDIKGLPVRKRRSINTIINKLAKEPHQKIDFSVDDKLKYKENSAGPNEITHNFNKFLNKLLSSDKPLLSEGTASHGNEEATEIISTMNGDDMFKDKEYNIGPKEITHNFINFVSKLLYSNEPGSSKVTASNGSEEINKIKTAINCDKDNNTGPKEINHNFDNFVTQLLSSNKPLSSEVTESNGSEETTKIETAITDKDNSARPNKITHNFNKFVRKLLSSNEPLSSELITSNGSEEPTKIKTAINGDNNLETTTEETVMMIRLMFS